MTEGRAEARAVTDVVTRVERGAVRVALVTALLALLARGGEPDWAAGVVGGWALVAGSTWLLRRSAERALTLLRPREEEDHDQSQKDAALAERTGGGGEGHADRATLSANHEASADDEGEREGVGDEADDPEPTSQGRTTVVGRGAYLGLALRFTGRYALLAVAAYVMIGCLRLSPVGLLVGASSIVVSASIEAIRTLVSSRQI